MLIHGLEYEVTYDNAHKVSIPVTCKATERRIVVNNVNLSGLWSIVLKEHSSYSMWSDESRNDFLDILTNDFADKINYAVGELIIAPKNNPEQYYKFNQTKSNDGIIYLFIEKLKCVSKKSRKTAMKKSSTKTNIKTTIKTDMAKQKQPRAPKVETATKKRAKTIEQPKSDTKSELVETTSKTPVKRKSKTTTGNSANNSFPVSLECFMLMRMSEALVEYAKLAHNDELKEYLKLKK